MYYDKYFAKWFQNFIIRKAIICNTNKIDNILPTRKLKKNKRTIIIISIAELNSAAAPIALRVVSFSLCPYSGKRISAKYQLHVNKGAEKLIPINKSFILSVCKKKVLSNTKIKSSDKERTLVQHKMIDAAVGFIFSISIL